MVTFYYAKPPLFSQRYHTVPGKDRLRSMKFYTRLTIKIYLRFEKKMNHIMKFVLISRFFRIMFAKKIFYRNLIIYITKDQKNESFRDLYVCFSKFFVRKNFSCKILFIIENYLSIRTNHFRLVF